jgi:hypothetical protein
MVAPPPNLTTVTGTVLDRRPHDELPDWDVVTLAVDDVAAVPGLRDLIGPTLRTPAAPDSQAAKPELDVAVRRELIDAAAPGWRLRCRVRLTPNGAMAESHPEPGELALDPPPETGPLE